jgi:ubiquinone/menaquinone biosynthesis C-methylase UbiE
MAGYYALEVEKFIFNSITSDLFTTAIDSNARVLDVGAGTGRLSCAFAAKGCSVTALDVSKSMLSHIENHVDASKIITVEGSAFKLPFEDESFDAVVSMDVEIHFPNWEKILVEKLRVCRKNGYIIFNSLSTENSDFLKNEKCRSFGVSDFFSRDFAIFLSNNEIYDIAKKYSLTVEAITPYNFLSLNSLLGYALDKEEARKFSELYTKAMSNTEFRSIISKFETTIVRELPPSASVTKIIRLKK